MTYLSVLCTYICTNLRLLIHNNVRFRLTITGICIPLALYLFCTECLNSYAELSYERIRIFGENTYLVSSEGPADLSAASLKLTEQNQPYQLTKILNQEKGIRKYRFFRRHPVTVNLHFQEVSGDLSNGYIPYETEDGIYCSEQKLFCGSWFPKESSETLCILERSTAVLLTGTEHAEGQYITYIDHNEYKFMRICGVMEDLPDTSLDNLSINRRCRSLLLDDGTPVITDRRVWINQRISTPGDCTCIYLFPEDTAKAGKETLRHVPWPQNVYSCSDQESLTEETKDTQQAVFLLSTGLLFFLILISGCMIMNTMHFSVCERVLEIGIRRAVGAGKRDILFQFLAEGWFFALYGTFLSCSIASAGLSIVSIASFFVPDLHLHPVLHFRSVRMVLFLSSVQTVLFSLQPSLHAASLQPVEALISE